MTPNQIVKKLKTARKQMDKVKAKVNELEIELQLICDHPRIMEADYSPGLYGFGNSYPPFRVCEVCGFSEEGWNCGYQILKNSIYKIEKEAGYKIRVGRTWKNHNFVVTVNDPPGTTVRKLYENAVLVGNPRPDETEEQP